MSSRHPSSRPNEIDPVISVRGLRRRYGDRDAVRGIDLEIGRGEIFALLGPNGAGKTTTVEILEGFRSPTAGAVTVLGVDPSQARAAWRERIGIVLQESAAEPGLSVRECLELYAGYYHAPRDVGETLELVALTEQADTRATVLSGGQRRRLDVALALIGDPELVFLDEPTTGFDPASRHAAWAAIEGLRELGTTILLTTHDMQEAERLADRVAVIAAGVIVAEGTPATLRARRRAPAQIAFGIDRATGGLPPALATRIEPIDDGRMQLSSTAVTADLHALTGWALEHGVELEELEVRRPTLEDAYLDLTDNHQPGSTP